MGGEQGYSTRRTSRIIHFSEIFAKDGPFGWQRKISHSQFIYFCPYAVRRPISCLNLGKNGLNPTPVRGCRPVSDASGAHPVKARILAVHGSC